MTSNSLKLGARVGSNSILLTKDLSLEVSNNKSLKSLTSATKSFRTTNDSVSDSVLLVLNSLADAARSCSNRRRK